MARSIQNGTNVDAPDAVYPDGKTRDKAGATLGTIPNEAINGDAQQFFAKLLRDASIVANGTPDNETNGYQLMSGLSDKIVKTVDANPVQVGAWQTPIYESNFSAGTPAFQYRLNKGRLEFRGEISNTTGLFLAFNLPISFRPVNDVYVSFLQGANRDIYSTLLIEANGDVSSPGFSTPSSIVSYFNNIIIID